MRKKETEELTLTLQNFFIVGWAMPPYMDTAGIHKW
jgi:hypothetical protein